jgi:hypothetical protein
MAIDKLTPRYLNFEDDERLVKRIEMTDAVNVRIDSDDDGDAGVIKNVVGNTLVSFKENDDGLPSGENKVIGSVHNNVKGEILFFVHNSNNNHRILKYDDTQNRVITVYKNEATGSVASASADTLGFKATDYVDGAVLVDKDGDTLLYFTNGRGEPKKINVDKAIRGDYPDGYEGVEAYISLIKKPPLEPPTFEFKSNPNIATNRLLERQFQFACQYVYDDGEVSAISPISKITKPYSQTQAGFFDLSELAKIDNEVEVTCKRTNSDIKKVRFLAREGNSGVFFIVKDVNTSESTSEETLSINFSNEKAYTPISNNENNKLFDAVGEAVRTITISGNRIFLGNYTEGFEPVDASNSSLAVNYQPIKNIDEFNHPPDTESNITKGMFDKIVYSDSGTAATRGNETTAPLNGQKKYISHFTKLDLSFLQDNEVNEFKSVFLSYRFSNVLVNYLGADVQAGVNAVALTNSPVDYTQNKGFKHKASDIQDTINIPLSQNYSSANGLVDAIVSAINSQPPIDCTVKARDGVTDWDDGKTHTGSIRFKIEARRNFLGYSGALSGQKVIMLFIKPDSVSVSTSKNSPDTSGKPLAFDFDFTNPTLDNAESYFRGVREENSEPIPIASTNCVVSGVSFNAIGYFDNGDDKISSFKAGANHAFGIVHQDKNGRLSTVTPLPDVEVGWFDSFERGGAAGRASVVIRIPETVKPPENAVRWFPVYAGNTSIGNFVQYTTNDAFNPTNTESLRVPDNTSIVDRMYISARGFEGKEESYIDNYNPKIKYSFASGDVMKIVSVNEDRSYSKEFPVLGYDFLTADDNPLMASGDATTATGFAKTGFFWITRKKDGESEFIVEPASASTNAWRNKCLVELRTPKYSSDDKVYYEIGESYPIVNAGTDNRRYSGQRTATSFTNLSVSGANRKFVVAGTERMFVGDVLQVDVIGLFFVSRVELRGDNYIAVGNAPFTTSAHFLTTATANLLSTQVNQAVVEVDDGDVYFRKRLLNYGFWDGSTSNSFESYVDYVEDYRVNDFVPNIGNDFGKPNAFSEEAGRIHRNSSITYSDAYVMDSDRLSLSSFNNSLANFLDIKNKYGAIQRMVDIEDAFYAVQEHKVTLFPVNRNVIQTAGGDASVTLSTDVVNLNSSKSFAGDYGCGNDPEAVVYYEGVLYFVDRKANKVFSISSSGIKEISDIFADSYIADKLNKADKGGEYNIYSGIDPNNDEYLLSTRTIVNKIIEVDQQILYALPANDSGSGKTNFTPHSINSTTFGNFNLLNFNFEDVDVNFEDMGNGVLYVDDGFSDNAMQLDTSVDNLTSGTSNIVYTNKDNTFLGIAKVDNTNKFVELDPS